MAVDPAVIGTELPPLELTPISRATLALFAGASGDATVAVGYTR